MSEIPIDKPRWAKTYKELASHLGISFSSASKSAALDGCPGKQGGRYDVHAWYRWLKSIGRDPDSVVRRGPAPKALAELQRTAPDSGEDVGSGLSAEKLSYEEAKRRKMEAEARTKQFQLEVLKGKHILATTVETDWRGRVGRAVTVLRSKLENELPPILSGLDAPAIRGELSEVVDEFCRQMQEQLET